MFDKRIEDLRHHFGITVLEDWCGIHPEWILAQDRCGPVLLDHLRLYLAQHNITLKNDQTPEHWKKHAKAGRIVQSVTDPDDGDDLAILNPFTILIDSAEQAPFTFQGIKTDSSSSIGGNKPIIVPTEWRALGRHPDSLGDYSLVNGLGRCHVERKSMEDAQSTILGWDGRRERFEKELANLSEIECGLVVVECTFPELVSNAPQYGRRSKSQNAKALSRSIIAYRQDYRVHWEFCGSRRLAEVYTFRWFERWWKKQREKEKAAAKEEMKAAKLQEGFLELCESQGNFLNGGL